MNINKPIIKVLHVDDSVLELKHFETIFNSDELLKETELTSFKNAAKARKACEKSCPDLALIDIHIGEESGLDLAAELRQRFNELTIIVRSNDANQGVAAAISGVDDYVAKDIETSSLIERLRFHITSISRKISRIEGEHSGSAVGQTVNQIEKSIAGINNSAVSSVHIKGDTGTGKEKIAGLFKPAVSIDCGALPESIVE